ncbi:MAG: cobyrinate a,c-diamide synthase [Planctomycetota bacterium]|nr:MAG: cobyrinate a,c-diamide synthase [Planctomycetota bacterium]
MRGIVLAGTTSGVGKTTLTTGVIGALRARGLTVAPFKVGPDYIDPTYHAKAAGRPCHNLDSWMLSHDALRDVFRRATVSSDFAVVEGVMGLFDGRSSSDEIGSTAEVAKLLGLPVVLVVDAAKVGRSVAALVLGYQQFDPDLRMAGVILNNVGSANHAAICREAILAATGLPVFGALTRDEALRAPERHLGLVPTVEGRLAESYFEAAANKVAEQVDVAALLEAGATPSMSSWTPPGGLWPASAPTARVPIAVARDEAFSFVYAENLALLEAWGAEVIPFSPLHDTRVPDGARGVLIGGGFPELYAEALASNRPMLESVREVAGRGVPVYAECGGLMYLGESLTDGEGRAHALAGVVPVRSSMSRARLTLGYRTATARADGPHVARGQTVRGHEFHWSTLEAAPSVDKAAYDLAEEGTIEGYVRGNVWASYVHLHFASDVGLAPRLVTTCAAER